MGRRRTGDSKEIPGDYQYRALTEGFVVQRFWHSLKMTTVDRLYKPMAGDTVLDLGCGSGVVSNYLAESGATVHGLDGNSRAIEFARSTFQAENLHFQLALVDEVPFPEESFQAIFLFEVLEHLYQEQAERLLRHLYGKLRPGGRLLLTTPNYRSLWPLLERFMDWANLAPQMDEEQHVSRPTFAWIRKLAGATGFEVERLVGGFGLAPFLSPISWKLAEKVDCLEHRFGGPMGNLICASLRKPEETESLAPPK